MDRTPQDVANSIGANMRAVEAALNANDVAAAQTAATALHQDLSDGFAVLNDQTDLGLDWSQIAGGGEATRGAHTDGGVKTQPGG